MQLISAAQVVGRGATRNVHAMVDFWFDGGWWEVEVIADKAESGQVVIRDPSRVVRAVPLRDLRASVTWLDGSWSAVTATGRSKSSAQH